MQRVANERLQAYAARLLPALEDERPYFYAFERILSWARRQQGAVRPRAALYDKSERAITTRCTSLVPS